jgi:hypothetical protein
MLDRGCAVDRKIWLAVIALAASAQPASAAGKPEDAVRPFYEHPGLELDPAARGRFVDPALKVFDDNDALVKAGEGTCLDPNMALDNADYDKAGIDGSLKMRGTADGDAGRVIVVFSAGGQAHQMEWKLRLVDGEWKIADILSISGEWALSQYNCE